MSEIGSNRTGPTTFERTTERETVVRRSFDAPVHHVFEAWSNPDLFRQWWVPQSYGLTLLSCDMDVRVGGTYRLEFRHPSAEQPMAFFGSYTDVVSNARIVWTNEEGSGVVVTTVTFKEADGKTMLVMHNLYPSKDALDSEIDCGATDGMPETMAQLNDLLVTLVKS